VVRRALLYAIGGAVVAMLGSARLPAQQAQQQHAGEYAAADIQFGATVYTAQCTQCHGPTGDSIAGVDLKSGRFRYANSDDDLKRIVTQGLPGTSMPGRRLDEKETTGIVAYIRNMRDYNAGSVMAGDLGRGRALFESKGQCLTCHQVGPRGAHTGPDLSDIGSQRNAGFLQQSLMNPTSRMMPINRPVRIVTKEGKTINGRRLNEDTFTVQIIDDQERMLSLAKSDFREYTILKTSPMPSYTDKLSAQEMADVVAYLVTLKGK
jgi:putative heme-binding domain-containing protein